MNSVQVTVVVDNENPGTDLSAEHGLSLHVLSENKALLFDCGQSDLVLRHLEALRLAQPEPEWIVVSHGHYDHTGGVPALLAKYPETTLCFHPDLLDPKWILDTDHSWRYGGVPLAMQRVEPQHTLLTTHAIELLPGIHTTGPIGCSIPSARFFRNSRGNLQKDSFTDEQALLIITERGLSILSGCMHSGLHATIRRARDLFPQTPFNALIGGMHLSSGSTDDFSATLNALRHFGFQQVMPLHCSGLSFTEYLSQNAPDILVRGSVGSQIII